MSNISLFLQNLIRTYGKKSERTIKVAYTLSIILFIVSADPFMITKVDAKGLSMEIELEEVELDDKTSTQQEFTLIKDSNLLQKPSLVQEEMQIRNMSIDTESSNDLVLLQVNQQGEDKVIVEKMEVIHTSKEVDEEHKEDIHWLFGKSMDKEEYEELIKQIDKVTKKQEKSRKAKKAKKAYDANQESRDVLARIVEAEAGGEDIKGRILVANVILNRVKDKEYPNTVKDVVFQKVAGKYQFSPILDKRYWSVKVSDSTIDAVDRALNGEDYSNGAIYFMARKQATSKNARWFDNNLKYLFKHGSHEFYK